MVDNRGIGGKQGGMAEMAEARAFPSDTLAPWAEIAPNMGPLTVAELFDLPDNGWRYEVVEGVLVCPR